MSESFFKKPPATHSALASVGALSYTPPPRTHADAAALIRRADALLNRWAEKYGLHNPQWLPPAGVVNWQEDAARYLAAHRLPAPPEQSEADRFCDGHCTWRDHHPDCVRARGVPLLDGGKKNGR